MNVLIQSGPGIGDIIQLLHMAHAIRRKYPDANIDLLIPGDASLKVDTELLSLQNDVNRLYWYSSRAVVHDIKLVWQLRKNRYDYGIVRVIAVSSKPSLWMYRIMRWAGCGQVIGTGYSKLDILVDVPEQEHYTERNARILDALGIHVDESDMLVLDKSRLDRVWFERMNIPKTNKIVAISSGTNRMIWKENGNRIIYDVKSWGYEKWFALAKMLSDKGIVVFLLGGKQEKREIEDKGLWLPQNKKIYNMLGMTSITESLTILEKSDLVVGAEGGMMHCASALGTKTLTIFGGTDPLKWNPGGKNGEIISLHKECAPCFLTRRAAYCKEHECLTHITVDIVYDKVCQILKI